MSVTDAAAAPITGIEARLVSAPLPRPWGEDVRENHFIAVRVTDADGHTGDGFSWTPTIGPGAVLALLREDIPRFALGCPADPAQLWEPLWRYLHEAGSGGLTTIAMAGLDLALWDLGARRDGTTVAARIGARREGVSSYGSGVNRHLSLEELVAQVHRWVAAGHTAVKIKVGGRSLAEDVDRVAAVREAIGPDRDLMIDANQLWTLHEAVAAVAELSRFRLRWLEEPLLADDLPGYRVLASTVDTPIAAGENIHTRWRFAEFFQEHALAIAQPNVVRVGGITPFLAIAQDADAAGVEVHPHLLPELSGQLAASLPGAPLVEDVEDASLAALGVLVGSAPVRLEAGHALIREPQPAGVGLGLTLRGEYA